LSRDFQVALCGYYGFGNMGDEFLATAILKLLEEVGISKDRIVILSNDPERTSMEFGVPSVSRWAFKDVIKVLRASRSLLLGGGGLFQDSTSVRSCMYYWGIIRMACLAGSIPWMFGQSVGPFGTDLGKFLARNAIGSCKARAVRDEGSERLLAQWGYDMKITPDPVLYLGNDFPAGTSAPAEGGYILVNVRPWKDDLPHALLGKIVESVKMWGYPFRFVALCGDDEDFIEGNLYRYPSLKGIPITRLYSFSDALELWQGARGAVGMRLHFTVLSTLFNVPCIAVPYDPKVRYFAREHGLDCWEGSGPLALPQEFPGKGEILLQERTRIREVFQSCWEQVMGG